MMFATEFEQLFEQTFSMSREQVQVELKVKGQDDEISILTTKTLIRITGRTRRDLLNGIYMFFEKCGMQFLITGAIFGKARKLSEIPQWQTVFNASVKNRGIRMHLNFVQDQSFFNEAEFQSFIKNLSRLKMNYLLFHMYNNQEWFPFTYQGATHLELELGNLGRRELPADMIGRDKIKTKRVWYPQEFEDITDVRELRDAVMKRYQKMMAYAKEFGIRLAASFEPEVISATFEEKITQWMHEEQNGKMYNLTTDWQEGWSGKKLAEINTLNPILKDVAVERAIAMYEAYPLLDELHLISREGTSFLADSGEAYREELKRLEQTLGIHFDEAFIDELFSCNEDTKQINPKAYPYWTVLPGQAYIGSFIGAIRYLEFAGEILKDERIRALQSNNGVEFVISLYSPNPKTIELVNTYAGKILPQQVRFDILGDYGARDICGQLDAWQPLLDEHQKTGMISWLEFDGNMDLAQGWTRAIYDNVKKASNMGIDTIYFNHWRLYSLEQNAYFAAQTCFDSSQSYESYLEQYLENMYGKELTALGTLAYEKLEEATEFCKKHHYNIGFTNDWVYQHSTDTPGYSWHRLHQSQQMFALAEEYFRQLAVRTSAAGGRHAEFMSDMCAISRYHLKAVEHLQKSKLPLFGVGCYPVSNDGNWPVAKDMALLVHEAYMALEYQNAYMETFEKWVTGCDQQGQLAHHQLGTIEPLRMHYQTLKEHYEASVKMMVGEL